MKQEKLHQCPICKLHYHKQEQAKACEDWCSKSPSCNLEIIKDSIENQKLVKE